MAGGDTEPPAGAVEDEDDGGADDPLEEESPTTPTTLYVDAGEAESCKPTSERPCDPAPVGDPGLNRSLG